MFWVILCRSFEEYLIVLESRIHVFQFTGISFDQILCRLQREREGLKKSNLLFACGDGGNVGCAEKTSVHDHQDILQMICLQIP